MQKMTTVAALLATMLLAVPASANEVESIADLTPEVDTVEFALCGGVEGLGEEQFILHAQNPAYRYILAHPSVHCPVTDISVETLNDCSLGTEGTYSDTMFIDINPECRVLLSEYGVSRLEAAEEVVRPVSQSSGYTPRWMREAVPAEVEQWRGLVSQYFVGDDVNKALWVISCESGGNPSVKNPTSSASGLFQNLGRFWPERSAKAGVGGADIFDPHANTAVAAWLVYQAGGWSHWNPSKHCWG